jgi:hypothetical protein
MSCIGENRCILKKCGCRLLTSLPEFKKLVLEKLQSVDKDSNDMVKLRRNLQFCPLLIDVQKYTNKS